MDAPRWANAPHDQPTCPSPPAPACYAHAPVLTGEKVLMGGFHAGTKRTSGGACIWPKPALRGRPRPPGRPLAPPRASWVVWWRARRRAWPGSASRYRPREKVPKNTCLEGPILTLPSYFRLAHVGLGRTECTAALIKFASRSLPAKLHPQKNRNKKKLDGVRYKIKFPFEHRRVFDCGFISWYTFAGKLQVPTKLPKLLLCFFTNISIVKCY
jgi:hypothetical protein